MVIIMSVILTTSPAAKVFSKNHVSYRIQSSSYSGLDNYRVVVRVLFEKSYLSGTFEQIAELEDTPTKDFTTFNIQAILDAALLENTSLQVPDITGGTPYLADNIRRYRISYAEKYGQPATLTSFTLADIGAVIYGGIDQQLFATEDYLSNISNSNSFFTWQPDGQKVSTAQAAYLAWHNYTGGSVDVNYNFTAYGEDGNVVETGVPVSITVAADRTAVLPVGYTQLGISAANSLKYRITVLNSFDDSSLAPLRNFYIDRTPAHCERSLLWYNSFNQPETLRLTGRTAIGLDIEREEYRRVLPYGFSPLHGELLQHSAKWGNTFTYRTGYLRKAEVDALQDMLIRNLFFEISEDGYFRMHLTGKRYAITECLQYLHSLDFSAQRSISPINFSRVSLSANAAGGFWELNNTGYWLTAAGGKWELPN